MHLKGEQMDSCCLCGNKAMTPVLDMGKHPIAHRYLDDPARREYVHSVVLMFCDQCGQLQLNDPIPGETLYENYVCLSSWKYQPHIPRLVEMIRQLTKVQKNSLVLEVGSNDGSFLKALREAGYQKLIGLEPAHDAQTAAEGIGIKTISAFFNRTSADAFAAEYGRCDFFLSRQMLEHVRDLKGFAQAMHRVMAPGGYVMFEVPNFMTNLNTSDYALWEEHVNYFTFDTLNYFLSQAGVREIHRESMVFSGENLVVVGQYVGEVLPTPPLDYLKTIKSKVSRYKDAWPEFREAFLEYLRGHKKRGGKVAIYGAGARICSLINFLGQTPYIEFIVDDQPEKQGKFMPGSKLPIRPASALYEHSIDLCLLGVNFECEDKVIAKHPKFLEKGGTFVSVLPPSHRLPDFWKKFQ